MSQFLPAPDGSLLPVQVLSYTGPALWRLDLGLGRVDVHVDALGYEDTAGANLPMDDVRRRVVPNFCALAQATGLAIRRLVFVATMHSSDAAGASIVAREFFSETIRAQVSAGEVDELSGRKKHLARWTTGPGQEALVNRIEVGEFAVQYDAANVARNVLSWQFDVNTSLRHPFIASPEGIDAFFTQAVGWTHERVATLRK